MFFKIGVVKNFAIFTAKHLSINRFSKGNSKTGDFLVNIAKFLRSFFFMEHLRWLLLHNQDNVLTLVKIKKLQYSA